jgi:WD40 repeat protein
MSSQGELFATGANRHQGVEGVVRIWNSSSGELVGEIGTDLNSIFGLAISPDCRLLAAGGGGAVFGLRWKYTGGVEVWSLDKKQRVARFGEELLFIKSIAFSPDGRVLLTSNFRTPTEQPGEDHRRVRLWRTSDFKKMAAFGEHEGGIGAACFSPDGKFVVFGDNPATVGARPASGLLSTLRHHRFLSGLLKNRKTNIYLHDLSSVTPLIRIWNTVNRREEPMLQLPKGGVEALAFSSDGSKLASCGSNLTTWDFECRNAITEFAQGPGGSRCLAFSPNGRILASGGGYQFGPGSPYEDCGVKLWDSASGRLITFLPHERPVHSLAFSPDGQTIAAGGELGELLMWNIESASSHPAPGARSDV